MKMPFVKSFSPDQPLRDALAAHAAQLDKIGTARANAAKHRESSAKILAELAESGSEDMDVLRRRGEHDMLAGVADSTCALIHAKLPALVAQIAARHLQLAQVAARASDAALAALKAGVRERLAPLYGKDSDGALALDRAVNTVVSDCEPAAAFHFYDSVVSVGVREGNEIDAAEQALENFERFTGGLKKFAEFQRKNVALFPSSAADMDEGFPLKVKAESSIAVQNTPEQRTADAQREQRMESFARARRAGNERETARLWKGFLTPSERAEVVREGFEDVLTSNEVDALLRVNLGESFEHSLRRVSDLADERTAALQQEHTATVPE